jgi:hypothetical protein
LSRKASPACKRHRDNRSQFSTPATLRDGDFRPPRALLRTGFKVNRRAATSRKCPSRLRFRSKSVKFESTRVVLSFTQVIAKITSVFAALFILFLLKTTLAD